MIPKTLRLLVPAIVLSLAACAEQTATPPATGTGQQQAAAAQAPAAGQAAPAGEAAQLTLTGCAQPPGDKMHFRVGENHLAVPQAAIRTIVPLEADRGEAPDKMLAQIEARLKDGKGCPETPFEASLVVLDGEVNDPLLAGRVTVLRQPSQQSLAGFTKLMSEFQRQQPENLCGKLGDDMLQCFWKEKAGERELLTLYLITTNTKQNLAMGAPLTARCLLKDQKTVVGCSIQDTLSGGIAVDAPLKSGKITTANLRSARDAAVKAVQNLML